MSIVEIENTPGRPPIKIDLAQAEQLCQLGCTLREVAGFFKCSEDTIQRALKRERDQTFSEFWDMHAAGGDISLRRAQYDVAVNKKDPKMLIWLGKQRLGQKEKQEIEHSGHIGGVAVEIVYGEGRRRG